MPFCLVIDSSMFPRSYSFFNGSKSPLNGPWILESIFNPLEDLYAPTIQSPSNLQSAPLVRSPPNLQSAPPIQSLLDSSFEIPNDVIEIHHDPYILKRLWSYHIPNQTHLRKIKVKCGWDLKETKKSYDTLENFRQNG
jgi:hypothetical protein